ncbi:GGDEF-domain containing protein [Methylobacterium oryzae]|uniref:GGDEF-domain containing protein n=1 Tax=Methylobacterium oryzae TaxID=334852 RepID=A0ABU7THQ8_9HYPH
MSFLTRSVVLARQFSVNGRRAWRGPRSVAVLGSLLALCVVIAACLLVKDLRDSTVQTTERNLRSLTTLLAEQADRTLLAVEVAENGLRDRLAGTGLEREDALSALATTAVIRERLDARASALPQIVALAIVDGRGTLLNASRRWPVSDRDVSDRPFFRQLAATAGTRAISTESVRTRDGVSMTLYVAMRISTAGGGTRGYILAAVDMRYFERLYANVSPTEADVISMVSEDRTMLARHPLPPGAIGRVVPAVPGLRRSPGDPEGSGVARMTTPIDGRDRFIAIRPLDHYPLIVGASRTVEATLTAWRRQTAALGVAVLMLAGALLALLRTNARQIRDRALLARSEAARRAAEAEAEGDRRLKNEYARFGTALDGMGQGLCVFDAAERVLFLNARMAALFDLPDAFRHGGATLDDLLTHIRGGAPQQPVALFVAELRAAATARAPATLTCPLADGRILGVAVEPVAAGDLVCTFEDETERRRAEALISHMAHHDALTGLPNRLRLDEAARRLLASPERDRQGALLLLDLDGFKQVNDVHGHPLGDALLRAVADRLRRLTDEGDLLARLGGDEFALVCGADASAAAQPQPMAAIALAARIVVALQDPFTIDGITVSIGTSVGIARANGADQSVARLFRDADLALYRSKAMGRGTWCLFDAQLDQRSRERLNPARDLTDRAA